jgi:hypothetical protein
MGKLAAHLARLADEREVERLSRRQSPEEKAASAYARDFREFIERNQKQYPLLHARIGSSVRALLRDADEHWQQTGRAPSIAQLCDLAEFEERATLHAANEVLLKDPANQAPAAKRERALRAVDKTLARVRMEERGLNSSPTFARAAVRRQTEGERRARTKAAIENAWRNEK